MIRVLTLEQSVSKKFNPICSSLYLRGNAFTSRSLQRIWTELITCSTFLGIHDSFSIPSVPTQVCNAKTLHLFHFFGIFL